MVRVSFKAVSLSTLSDGLGSLSIRKDESETPTLVLSRDPPIRSVTPGVPWHVWTKVRDSCVFRTKSHLVTLTKTDGFCVVPTRLLSLFGRPWSLFFNHGLVE